MNAGLDYPSWTASAVCAQTDPAAYFPEKGSSSVKAKQLCRTVCPVREQCLEYALDFERPNPSSAHGIYGGMSARERKDILHQRAAA